MQFRITEIFYSIQGESDTVGWPTVFVRLTGCPLRCFYCDTAYAFKGGQLVSKQEIIEQVASFKAQHVTITGGEPLAQPNCIALLTALCDLGYTVSLETSGALDVAKVDSRVIKVMDFKTPASGESQRNLFANIDYLQDKDQVKFVICDREDYEWAKAICEQYNLLAICQVLFSSSFNQLAAKQLAEWILCDRINVRFQLQVHKFLWDDEPGH